jgi:hypothetical protein
MLNQNFKLYELFDTIVLKLHITKASTLHLHIISFSKLCYEQNPIGVPTPKNPWGIQPMNLKIFNVDSHTFHTKGNYCHFFPNNVQNNIGYTT